MAAEFLHRNFQARYFLVRRNSFISAIFWQPDMKWTWSTNFDWNISKLFNQKYQILGLFNIFEVKLFLLQQFLNWF